MTNYLRTFGFFLLVLFTSLSVTLLGRYQDAGPELLQNQNFEDGLNYWQASGPKGQVVLKQNGAVRLDSFKKRETIQIYQKFSNDQNSFHMVRLKGVIRVDAVQQGEKPWHLARLLLVSYDKNGKWLPVPHQVVALQGSTDWQAYEKIFYVLPEAHEIRAILQLSHATGTLLAQELSLRQVVEAEWYPWLKWHLLGLWAVFLLWVFVSCLKRGKVGKLGSAMLFVSFLVMTICTAISADVKHDLQESFAGQISQADWVKESVKKIMQEDKAIYFSWLSPSRVTHFSLFAVFGLFGALFLQGRLSHFLWDIFMLAVATEMIQFYVDGRTPQIGDGVADFAGGLVGVCIVGLIRSVRAEPES